MNDCQNCADGGHPSASEMTSRLRPARKECAECGCRVEVLYDGRCLDCYRGEEE